MRSAETPRTVMAMNRIVSSQALSSGTAPGAASTREGPWRARERGWNRRRLVPRIAVLLAATAVLVCSALARPAAAGPVRAARSREDLRETMTLLMMVRMKNELGLSPQQYEQVLPKVERRERSRQSYYRARRERLQKLREALAREGAKDAEFSEAVDGIVALDEADRRQDSSLVADLRKILSPRQQAQLVLFRQRFRQWVEGRMLDAQELRRRYGRYGATGRRGASGPPQGEEGDGPASPEPDRP